MSLLLRILLAATSPPARTDEELFAAYRDGQAAAFDELWRRYEAPLRRYARRRVGSTDEVDELVQQTFLHLHRSRKDFKQGLPLRPWLYTICLNVCRHHLRKRSRRGISTELHDANTPSVAAHDIVADEDARRVRAALAELPEHERIVIELHWLHGLGMKEVAEVVGAGLSAVKVRAHRGYKRLRVALQEEAA
ncbi:MAG: RNA polymerase sigma factor [Deltaproteobacteria bacterium]|nr:RNA polymerase sigma factor [Deltaproteobacteria bacterium]